VSTQQKERTLRTTYDKTVNVILVELSQEEVNKYCATELSEKSDNLRQVDYHYELQIPCGPHFFRMTQRQKGGDQSWGPNELRQAVRAAVANRLVTFEPEMIETEQFKNYKNDWNDVFQGLLRNVRLKFPNRTHPQKRMSRQDFQYRRDWRRQHVLQE
jgi:hypothetical protein